MLILSRSGWQQSGANVSENWRPARTYIEKVLKDYKSGVRKDPVMAGMAAALSAEDIDNLAFYYSSQSGLQVKR